MDAPPVRAGTMWAACHARLMPTIRLDGNAAVSPAGLRSERRLSWARDPLHPAGRRDDPARSSATRRMAHAIPSRDVRDLGDAYVLYDPRDPDPFWNRMVERPVAGRARRVRPPARRRRSRCSPSTLGRVPHIWPSPATPRRRDLVARLQRHGFRDVGGGHVMVLEDPAACAPLPARRARGGRRRCAAICTARTDARPGDLDDIALVLAESFGALPARAGELAADLRLTLDDPRVALVLVRVDGEPAAVAKATTFDGFTYLSSIGTREAFRGRGLARDRDPPRDRDRRRRIGADRVPRRVHGQRAGPAAVRAAGVRVAGRVAGPAARGSR